VTAERIKARIGLFRLGLLDERQLVTEVADLVDRETAGWSHGVRSARAGETRAGETRAGETRAGETRAGETRVGETRAGEARAGDAGATGEAGVTRHGES
jgi:uncharacterized low-complexity protein